MSNKMRITISFSDEDGVEEVEPVTVEVDVQNHRGFRAFREGFDKLERTILQASKEATEKTIEAYMNEISKKSL
jgi:soluble cytochrome b562